jgi:Fur family peroxide stress response transcriptional regulator
MVMTFRMTPQRMAVLEALEGNRKHPSAEDLYRDVRKIVPTITLATVYNILEMLKNKGSVRELNVDPKRKRYDPDTVLHHHMICRGCGMVSDVHKSFELALSAEEKKGFRIEDNHIEFYGTCPRCRERR